MSSKRQRKTKLHRNLSGWLSSVSGIFERRKLNKRTKRKSRQHSKRRATSNYSTPTLVMNIKRQYFAAILAQPQRKFIEFRDMSEYWERRLELVGPPPFNLRLLNGMTPPVPEATIRVTKVVRNENDDKFELYFGEIISVNHWDRKNECPTE